MNDGTSVPRTCEICGGPIRETNMVGVCQRNPECKRIARKRAHRIRHAKPGPPPKTCKHPDGCPKPVNARGWCQMHYARLMNTGDPGRAESKVPRRPVYKAGDIIGCWTVIEGHVPGRAHFPCECECGNQRLLGYEFLLRGDTGSCICKRSYTGPGHPLDWPGRMVVSAGEVFGHLTVLEDARHYEDRVRCRCECGKEAAPRAGNLRSGNSQSCGCKKGMHTHGLSKHPLYPTWNGMIFRCTNPGSKEWAAYGGRGITVCDRWLNRETGLLNFIADMGERPRGKTLDRINNDAGYSPQNCKWSDASEQSGNRRKASDLTREIAILRAQVDALISAAMTPRPRRAPARPLAKPALVQDALF